MIESGRSEKDDDQFQGALNADDTEDEGRQPDAQGFGLDLGSLLGGLMGGQTPGQPMPGQMDQAGAQAGGLDLGALLGGLLGGMPDMGGQMGGAPGMGGSPLDGILGGVTGDLSAKTGLPKQIISMGVMFLISKLMSGGLGGNQQGGQGGGLDIGAILGGLMGGGGMPGQPGMDQGVPQEGGINTPEGGEVLGKIGRQINDGLNSPGLTAGGMQQNGLASEFAEMSGMNEDEAAQSLSQIVDALKQSGLGA